MTEMCATFFLSFAHTTVLIPLVLLGYIWINRGVFYDALCLLFLSMLFSYALKVTFQVPLSPLLHQETFALPSGHMQMAVVFYGWLALQFKKPLLRTSIFILLIGLGFSLIHKGYHDLTDVLAAVVSGSLLLAFYKFWAQRRPQLLPGIVLGAGALCLLYSAWIYHLKECLWMPAYFLLGLILAQKIFSKMSTPPTLRTKVLESILAIFLFLSVSWIFEHTALAGLPPAVTMLQWGLIGFGLPAARRDAQALEKRIFKCKTSCKK